MRKLTTVAAKLPFAEGPRWRDGALHFSDMHGRRVLRMGEGDRLETVATLEAASSGLGWLTDGRLLVVAMEPRRVMRVEADGRVVEHADLSGIATHNANDMITRADGTAYVGNFGFSLFPLGTPCKAALAKVTPQGRVSVAADDLFFPNGIALSADERTLVVAESAAYQLTAFTVGADGELSDRRVWAPLGANEAPDGVCLDAEGAAWVAVPHHRKFVRLREGGEVLETIAVEDHALACCLGGLDRRTLYMTTSFELEPQACLANPSASVLTTRVEVPGAGAP